mgnify:CR=1 FL=1
MAKKLEKIGNHSSDTAELVFEDVRVPVANRIGEEGMGFIYQMKQFQKERMIAALGAAAGAQKMLERTVQYVKDRTVFGKPLALKQHVQFTLRRAADRDRDAAPAQLPLRAHVRRRRVSARARRRWPSSPPGRLVRRVADWCLQFHGGYGYMDEYPSRATGATRACSASAAAPTR